MMDRMVTPMVRNLLIANLGVFLLATLINFHYVEGILALRHFKSDNFQVYQVITYMFMHADFQHIFFNMLMLFFAGPWLERVWGAKRFIIYYLICGIGAAFIFTLVNTIDYKKTEDRIEAYRLNPTPESYELIMHREFREYSSNPELGVYFTELPREFEKHPNDPTYKKETVKILDRFYQAKLNTPMVGASGAIFGILIGMGLLFPNSIVMLLFPPIPVKVKYLVAFLAVTEVFAGINRPNDSIAHFAHIGGMIVGYLIIVYWRRKRDRFY